MEVQPGAHRHICAAPAPHPACARVHPPWLQAPRSTDANTFGAAVNLWRNLSSRLFDLEANILTAASATEKQTTTVRNIRRQVGHTHSLCGHARTAAAADATTLCSVLEAGCLPTRLCWGQGACSCGLVLCCAVCLHDPVPESLQLCPNAWLANAAVRAPVRCFPVFFMGGALLSTIQGVACLSSSLRAEPACDLVLDPLSLPCLCGRTSKHL